MMMVQTFILYTASFLCVWKLRHRADKISSISEGRPPNQHPERQEDTSIVQREVVARSDVWNSKWYFDSGLLSNVVLSTNQALKSSKTIVMLLVLSREDKLVVHTGIFHRNVLLKRSIVILGSSPRSHFKDDTVAFPSFWLVEKRAGLFSCATSKLSTDDAFSRMQR